VRLSILILALLALLVPTYADARPRHLMPQPTNVTVVHGLPVSCQEINAAACTDMANATIYVADAHPEAFVMSHERGHVFDWQYLDDAEHTTLMARMHMAPPWWIAWTPQMIIEGARVPRSPGEVFADAYAACDLGLGTPTPVGGTGMRWVTWETAYGWFPTRHQQRRVCAAIRRFAATEKEVS
jgi:hypothetical protein